MYKLASYSSLEGQLMSVVIVEIGSEASFRKNELFQGRMIEEVINIKIDRQKKEIKNLSNGKTIQWESIAIDNKLCKVYNFWQQIEKLKFPNRAYLIIFDPRGEKVLKYEDEKPIKITQVIKMNTTDGEGFGFDLDDLHSLTKGFKNGEMVCRVYLNNDHDAPYFRCVSINQWEMLNKHCNKHFSKPELE